MKHRVSLMLLVVAVLAVTVSASVSDVGSSVVPRTPLAAFTYQPCWVCAVAGNVISFNANWSASPSGPIVLYRWDFGDGTPAQETSSPQTGHLYGAGPNWLVTLTIKDSRGFSDTINQLVAWGAVPRFSFQPTMPIIHRPITFDASASQVISGQDSKKFSWNFGDGSTDTGAIVTHSYLVPGFYRVVLTYSTVYGDVQASKTVDVETAGGGCPHCHLL